MILSKRPFQIVLFFLTLIAVGLPRHPSYAETPRDGTSKHPIIDSKMTQSEAFDGLDPK